MDSLRIIFQKLRYFSPAWVFASINILMGTWVLYIPHVKEKLDLDDGQLGIALFCYALGTLAMIPFVPIINKNFGTGRYTILGICLFSVAFVFPLLMPSFLALCVSLFVIGMFSGSTDITMNALVSEIEKIDKVNFMSAAHGFFSLGGVIGAGIGSFLIGRISPIQHLILISAAVIITNLLLAKNYFSIREEEAGNGVEKDQGRYHIKLLFPLIPIAFISFAIMGSEGSIEQWSKLYLLDIVKINSETIAGYGFILFSAGMTLGRFFGDRISSNYGSFKLIVGGCLIAVISYLGILSMNMFLSLIGFGILGLGLSVIIPETFRIAGKAENVSPSMGISFVSGIGYVGFLLGPVLMGFISKGFSLRYSFGFLFVVALASGLLALFQVVKRKE